MPGEERVYTAINKIPNKENYNYDVDAIYSQEFLSEQNPSGCPPHKLRLKVNTIVMLIRNMNTKTGLCNGTRLVIENMRNESLECKVLSGPMKDKKVFIPKMNLVPSDTKLPIAFQRRQFPVIPAFCITINKSQGQTFNFVGVDCTKNVFSHGQMYVACSRCRTFETLKFQVPIYESMIRDRHDDGNDREKKKRNFENLVELLGEDFTVKVKNIVYEQVIPKHV